MPYEGYTEKRKASNKRYMDKLTRITLWLKPEEKKITELSFPFIAKLNGSFVVLMKRNEKQILYFIAPLQLYSIENMKKIYQNIH